MLSHSQAVSGAGEMKVEAHKKELHSFDVRGMDIETVLIGPVTQQIIDADRLVRTEFRNGFPNWMMYRTALAGDSIFLPRLREWAVAFTWVYCLDGAVKRKTLSDELIGCVSLDVLSRLVFSRWLAPHSDIAATISVDRNTYKRLRDRIYARLAASLDEYWIRLIIAYREVRRHERSEHGRYRR